MVIGAVEVGVEGELPAPEVRAPLDAVAWGGVRIGTAEVGVQVRGGRVQLTEAEWDEGFGPGWEGTLGVRGGVRLPVRAVTLRPVAVVSLLHRVQENWWEETVVPHDGLLAGAGLDVLLVSESGWLALGAAGAWSTVDASPRVTLSLTLGTDLGGGPGAESP